MPVSIVVIKSILRSRSIVLENAQNVNIIESDTAGTLFHKLKFELQKSLMIVFEMSCTTKGMSSPQIAKRYGITQKTVCFFMQKVKIAMESSKIQPILALYMLMNS